MGKRIRIYSFSPKMKQHGCFIFGLFILLGLGLLYLFAGESIPVTVHDQLDYVVPMSELQASRFGESFFPELMGGMPASAVVIGIPGMALFYQMFPSVVAFSLNLMFVLLISYCSMYACLLMLGVRRWSAAITAFMYACLPFYSVYALSCMGVPLVVCAVLRVIKKKSFYPSVFLVLIYGVWSSFVWAGYTVCFLLLVVAVVQAVRREKKEALELLALLVILFMVYLVSNFDTIVSSFSTTVVGHRAEFDPIRSSFDFRNVIELFCAGQYHAVSNQKFILYLMLVLVLLGGLCCIWMRIKGKQSLSQRAGKLVVALVILLVVAFVIALFAEFYTSLAGDGIRNILPASLQSFQLDRFYWLYPALWYIGAGLSFELVMVISRKWKITAVGVGIVVVVFAATISLSVPNNNVMKNAKHVLFGADYDSITWDQVFAEDIFDEIQSDLNTREEADQSGYRVGSVGIHPLIAMHNGFYTIDGYSVNYPLEYKHRFSEIIEQEIELDQDLYDYFWRWGSRCYLFSHELGRNYLLSKNSGKHIEDSRIDVEAFKDIGGDYLFSAVPIDNASEIGLELVGEYTDDESFYDVWVYAAN